MRALPDRQRAALLLREIDGLSYGTIAAEMATTIPGVKSLLVRARRGLLGAAAARGTKPAAPARLRTGPRGERRGLVGVA
jgi:DNA-directed RNA polymerase specialized sigma24 family protein